MANVAHSTLTGADLHESKGYDTATAGQVRVANGSGAGVMQKIGLSELDTAEIFDVNQYAFTVNIEDASSGTATLNRAYLVMPFNCTVTQVYSIAYAAIATTDNVLTVANHSGNAMGTITVSFAGSAIGDIDTITTITTNNTFTAGQRLSVISDSGSATVCPMTITIIVTRTA